MGKAKNTITVLLLKRTEADVPKEEMRLLKQGFPAGTKFNFVSGKPNNPAEHLELCRKHKADIVLLPHNDPLPIAAMQEDFSHLTIIGDQLVKLKELKTDFELFDANEHVRKD